MNDKFKFSPAPWIPYRDEEVLKKCREIKREDMEKHPNPDFKIKIVEEPTPLFVADLFHRIYVSDITDTRFTAIFPNPWKRAYKNVALLCNRYGVSARNVHTFNMDEWADDDGNVAPLSYPAGLGHAFMQNFYGALDPELRPPEENVHYICNENVNDYSKIIEDIGGGGADVCYSATGWAGHIAFIDPNTEAFKADSIEEFLKLGSRIVTLLPITVAQNSLSACYGSSGDVAAVPWRAATIGPRDVANARDRFEMHSLTNLGGITSWQRMISRLELYGPVTMQLPASIVQLFKTTVFVSEDIARPFTYLEDMEGWM